MTAQQLSVILSGLGDKEIVIKLSQPSVGRTAHSTINGIQIGFDWDDGLVFIVPDKPLIRKEIK